MARRRAHPREEELLALIDGELDFDRSQDVEEHCQGCVECGREYERLRRVEDALIRLPRPALSPLDRARLEHGIAEQLDANPVAPVPASRPLRRLLVAGGLLAAGILVGVLIPGAFQPETPETGPWTIAESGNDPGPLARESAGGSRGPMEADPTVESSSPSIVESDPLSGMVVVALSSEGESATEVRREGLRARLRDRLATVPPSHWDNESIADSPREITAALLELARSDDVVLARSALEALALEDDVPWRGRAPVWAGRCLEEALRREALAELALRTLLRLDTGGGLDLERAWRAALEGPHTREDALLARCSAAGDSAPWREITRSLRGLVRSPSPGDQALLERALTVLPTARVEYAGLLADLYAEGVARPILADAVSRVSGAALDQLLEQVQSDSPTRAETALRLCALGRLVATLEPMTSNVRRGRHVASTLDAMRALGGTAAARTLLSLASDGTLAMSRRHLARDTALALLAELENPVRCFRILLDSVDEPTGRSWIALVPRLPTARAGDVLLALAEDVTLENSSRSVAAVLLAERAGERERDSLLALLEQERLLGDESAPSLVAPLLVSLYQADSREGLQSGLERLGLELGSRRLRELGHLASLAAADPFAPRFPDHLVRIERLLAVGP